MIMQAYVHLLKKNPLFEGITESEIFEILSCSKARVAHYEKGGVILSEQSEVRDIGIIIEGKAQASKLELSGKRFVIAHHSRNSIFGVVLSISSRRISPVTVTAVEPTSALLIPVDYVISYCANMCGHHIRLLGNMLNIVSEKYFELHDRINCIIKPTLREKIMCYLGAQALRRDGIFEIPFNRETLAEYLNSERSAVSRELSSMKKDGIIDYHKNSFKILKPE